MNRASFVLWGVISLAAAPLGAVTRYPSPHGHFEVAFETPGALVSWDHDHPSSLQGVSYKRYSVQFYTPGYATPAAVTEFFDVQAKGDTKGTPVSELVSGILWSPNEDFAVLPAEHWERAEGVAVDQLPEARRRRQIVSLNRSFPWQTTPFELDDAPLEWFDGLHLAGNVTEHCRQYVGLFTAPTGKTTALMEAASPIGYRIVGREGRKFYMKKTLDDCASPADESAFRAECVVMDLSFMRREIGPCPQ